MKRLVDIIVSAFGLIFFSPVVLILIFLVWKRNKSSPFCYDERVGMNGKPFKMVVLGSVKKDLNHPRFQLYGIVQLWNVLKGDMSLVGPKPKKRHETDRYTAEEKRLLTVRPGMTNMASVVFADQDSLLNRAKDRDLAYNQIIRPWSNRLGLIYIDNRSFSVDFKLVWVTIAGIFVRYESLDAIGDMLVGFRDNGIKGIDEELIAIARRDREPFAVPPPGATQVVQESDLKAA